MTISAIIEPLDHLLKPLGFERRQRIWNRPIDRFVDVVDVQVSKAGGTFTINAGVVDLDAYKILWGRKPDEFVEQPMCTVCARIGELTDGKDKWWKIESPSVAGDVGDHVASHLAPFFERMHNREAMKQWFVDHDVKKKRYPPPIINLAILESLLGNSAQSCALLAELLKASTDAWHSRVTEVAKQLHCV